MREIFFIVMTLLVALMLSLLSLPVWAMWLRPVWVLLVLIYWVMRRPDRVNVGIAWIVGMILDILNGTLLGEHALALTIVTYLVARIHSRFKMFPLLQQSLSILLLVGLYQLILFCIQGALGHWYKNIWYWLPALTSMALWPLVYYLLQGYRYRFRIS